MPAAITFLEEQRRLIDPRTPEGIHNRILFQTGDKHLAEAAMTEAEVQAKLRSLEGATI